MLYDHLRRQLFKLDPEKAHHVSLLLLKYLGWCLPHYVPEIRQSYKLMGIEFPNRIGLAAGLDKNGEYVDALSHLGFGFIEIGTVTPRPQEGNPTPRLFRLVEDQALINRLGFNNKGVDYCATQLQKMRYKGILGVNIGKNASTALEHAHHDYRICMDAVYAYASYITVNISSPNTPGLRDLQHSDYLNELLIALKEQQSLLTQLHQKYVPLLIKISPDLSDTEIQGMAQAFIQHRIDGVIATNTTLSREGLQNKNLMSEAGGLSGKPLFSRATGVLKKLTSALDSKIPVIAVGGVSDVNSAREKIANGASLVQLYTGLIYHGPRLIRELVKHLQ